MDWNVAGMENIRIIAHIYTDFDDSKAERYRKAVPWENSV